MTEEYLRELFAKYARIVNRTNRMYEEGTDFYQGYHTLESAFGGMESVTNSLMMAFEKQLGIELGEVDQFKGEEE